MGEVGDPVFPRVAIVGLGLIGGSLAFAARRTWPSTRIVAIDRESVLREALARRAIDEAAGDLSAAAGADLVVLAAPVRQNLTLLDELKQHVGRNTVVSDVGGTKRAIVAAAAALTGKITFIGGHPLGGGSRGGFEFATANLFARRPWIFTPHDGADGRALDRLTTFVAGLGAVPTTMTAPEHDRLLAFLSHLPQLTATTLMAVVGDAVGEDGLRLAGQGLVDTTRLASSPADVWRDICATNADAIGAGLDLLIERLADLRRDLPEGEGLDGIFDRAARRRADLMKGRD